MQAIISFAQQFVTEGLCFDYLEELRWGGEPECPLCGSAAYKLKVRQVYKCKNQSCQRQFTARVGTIFEGSKLPLRKWFLAVYWLIAHKKGMSSLQAARKLDITQKTAWHLLERLRFILGQQDTGEKHRQPLSTDLDFDGIMRLIVNGGKFEAN
jgi:transposase-like protein